MEKKENLTILCIDDEEEICFALKTLFRTQGWYTVTALDVKSGVTLFNRHHPQLVLIDYHMPGVNGVEGVRMLRHLSADVPIIVFTIDESQAVADKFISAGASDFALKPIKAPDIISRVRLHLRLLEHQNAPVSPAKGISPGTLSLILACLKRHGDEMTAKEISEETNLAPQTVFRYLQYLLQQDQVGVKSVYGKVGRPKQLYYII